MVYNANYNWDNANNTIRPYLNGEFLETITGTVGAHQWSDLISNPKWYIADNNSSSWTLTAEKNKTTLSANYKIGLMYASDYYNSWTYASNKNSWLHITNGMTGNSNTYSTAFEWTMSRYGYDSHDGNYFAWNIDSDGKMLYFYAYYGRMIRPVFYLTPNITLTGGGTESDPFIIHTD